MYTDQEVTIDIEDDIQKKDVSFQGLVSVFNFTAVLVEEMLTNANSLIIII